MTAIYATNPMAGQWTDRFKCILVDHEREIEFQVEEAKIGASPGNEENESVQNGEKNATNL